MSSGILFNQGQSKGNPYALGVNLPVPIVLKENGVTQSQDKTLAIIKNHGKDDVLNGVNGVYNKSNYCPSLSVYLQNSRYAENFVNKNIINAPMFKDINALNPKIMLFQWSLKKGKTSSSRNRNPILNGKFAHPSNIIDGIEQNTYSNFGKGQTGINVYAPLDNDFNGVTAQSEWALNNNPYDYENKVNLVNLNPFRYYKNADESTTKTAYFNYNERFFDPNVSFDDFVKRRYRTGPHKNNKNLYFNGRTFPITPSQNDFNIYLSFALVINNPENPNQYIIGPFSKVVKQRLVMGYNSVGQKVAKAFTYFV